MRTLVDDAGRAAVAGVANHPLARVATADDFAVADEEQRPGDLGGIEGVDHDAASGPM